MIEYIKVVMILTLIASTLLSLGIVAKLKILYAPIKMSILIDITDFMEQTLENHHNKNIIYDYFENEFNLKEDENGEYSFNIKQMEKAIKANHEILSTDNEEYSRFSVNTRIIKFIDWCDKKSIKLGLNTYFICICIVIGQVFLNVISNR